MHTETSSLRRSVLYDMISELDRSTVRADAWLVFRDYWRSLTAGEKTLIVADIYDISQSEPDTAGNTFAAAFLLRQRIGGADVLSRYVKSLR